MADSSDYDSWRNQTIGGIKYRFLGTEGSFDAEEATIEWRALFRTQDLFAVAQELFPPPSFLGSLAYPQVGVMPGLPSMVAKRASFKTQEGIDLPIDPFMADPSAVTGTYHGYIEVSVTFGPSNKVEADPNDPRTFLEISANTGGEYIFSPPNGNQLIDEDNSEGEEDDIPSASGPVEEGTLKQRGTVTPRVPRPNRHPNLPTTVLVPTTEWSVTWKQIPYSIFRNVIVWRLRTLNGRVNSLPLPWLMGAEPETVLFAGFTYKESYTWRNGLINTPPIDVNIKLIEKRVLWRGIICGHNHVYEPGKGWARVILQDGLSPYRGMDLNLAFRV